MSSFNKLCRLCLKKCRPDDNFEDLGHDYSIRCRIAIQEIFNIINGSNATFPTKVCIDCSQKVLLFYDYFVVVQKNQEILVNGINMAGNVTSQNGTQSTRPIQSLLNPLNKRSHYTSIPSANILHVSGTSGGASEMEIDNTVDGFRVSDVNSLANVDTKPEIFSTPKPFLTFEERKAIEEKIKMIKDSMTDDEKIKIFYGLQCTTCNTSVEFNKLVEYEEHCLKEHDIEFTSFMCCKTKIKRQFLIDHIEYHLGTPAVRVLRPRGQTLGPAAIFNNHENSNNTASTPNNGPAQENSDTSDTVYKFPCNKCERSYMVKSSLKRHMTLAHGFVCDVCDKVFDNDSKLKKHQFIFHSTDGPFKCNMCPSEHTTRQDLYNHKRWHTRQSTSINPIAFSLDTDGEENDDDMSESDPKAAAEDQTSTNLDDSRLFKCSLCSGAFHSNRNLKIHMSLKHKRTVLSKTMKKRYASPFKASNMNELPRLRCKVCGFLSMYRQNLKRHIRLRHAEQAETEDDVNALCEDSSVDKDQDKNQHEVAIQEEHEIEMTEKSTDNLHVSQIKEEQDDSINMFQCLSNSLLS